MSTFESALAGMHEARKGFYVSEPCGFRIMLKVQVHALERALRAARKLYVEANDHHFEGRQKALLETFDFYVVSALDGAKEKP